MSDNQMILQEKRNMWWALWLPSADHWRISRLQRMEREALGGMADFTNWADGAQTPKRPRWLEFKGQSIIDTRDAQRENSGDLQDPAEYKSGHTCEEIAQSWGKNNPKGSAGTVAGAHTGLRRVPVSTSPTEKNPLIHKVLAEYLKKICHNRGK